jgi:primosomal protein N' (replication factor Y)
MADMIGRIAVNAATYAIDKLYHYRIPAELQKAAQSGVRVWVPFGRGNKACEGILVQTLPAAEDTETLKSVIRILDDTPVLDAELMSLAIYMREHLFCTFFDCVKAMLPSGLWFRRRESYGLCPARPQVRLTPDEQKILQHFQENPEKEWTTAELQKVFIDCDPGSVLRSLQKKEMIFCKEKLQPKATEKTVRQYQLAVSYEEAMTLAQKGRSAVRMDVVSILQDGTSMEEAELLYMTGASKSILQTMVKNGILRWERTEVYRLPDYTKVPEAAPIFLSQEQNRVFQGLRTCMQEDQAQTALLYGVTGSGKTQIYIELIAEMLQKGKSVLVLVPEIGLTPQLIAKFISHFRDRVCVMHSALSVGERYDNWKKAKRGQCVVIGTRSAVFAPVPDLGMIVIDEEQDAAYKSESTPRYHALELAQYRVRKKRAFLLLGSATPSVDSYYHAEQGHYKLFILQERYQGNRLPNVKIADMRGLIRQGFHGSIGPVLQEELQKNLENHQQSILFLNRRGNSKMVSCPICGWTPVCPNCSISMTYHSVNGRLICHYCGTSQKLPQTCPECGSRYLQTEVAGTQKVEEELHQLFPSAGILRMDADTVMTKNAHEKLFHTFASGKADILLGTQMVTKGLDFENVTLVGVLDADQSLYAQDYRAKERTFSLLTQVVGRAGRRFLPGRAVIQTYSPEDPTILLAAKQNYEKFYQQEILIRKALLCPPIVQILVLTASGESEEKVLQSMLLLKQRIESLMLGQFQDFRYPVLGPSPASVVRVNKRFRYHLMIRCPDSKRRRALISGIIKEFAKNKQNRGVTLFADINPENL